jgi:hypothetical protein
MKFLYQDLIQAAEEYRILESKALAAKSRLEGLKLQFQIKMEQAGTETYKANLGTISLITSQIPLISDWTALTGYVQGCDAFDLLQKRIVSTAWRDRQEAGAVIPGIEPYTKKLLRIS